MKTESFPVPIPLPPFLCPKFPCPAPVRPSAPRRSLPISTPPCSGYLGPMLRRFGARVLLTSSATSLSNSETALPLPFLRLFAFFAAILLLASPLAAAETHRLHDGLTLFVHNPTGRPFDLSLDVRDINLSENGPREVLLKVYDPVGANPVRTVIPDDGVTSPAALPAKGALGHEAWYLAHLRMMGTEPQWRWSAPSQPDRLAATPKRTFTHTVPAGPPGIWRILLVGATDHYVTARLDPALKYGIAGHPDWLHGHGALWRQSHLYVPRGAVGAHLMLAELDLPRTRRAILRAPDGTTLAELTTPSGTTTHFLAFTNAAALHDQLLTLDVSPGENDFMVNLKFTFDQDPLVQQRGTRVVPAVFAPDAATARALGGGALYHDNQLFWQPYQIALHDWLKTLTPEDFVVKDAAGKLLEPAPSPTKPAAETLPTRPGFLPVNGRYWQPPACDRILHHWPAHKNRAALNVALRDLAAGLRSIGPNDHVTVATGGPYGNMAYEFGNYAFHYWRPSWRVLQESDAPAPVKQAVRDAMLVCGDRLAFCRSWERVNGNAFAQILSALRYCAAATGDPLQQQLFDTYWHRFATGGWGERVGLGPSGPVQEGFAYAYHYASYILETWQSVLTDLPDPRMQTAYDRIRTWFSYTLADEQIPAGPWSSRTHHYPHCTLERDGPFAWKGLPGPDFTVNVNDAGEWFAARRPTYYALTYHGRLSPKWVSNAHQGQSGYGGGMLCQLHIPGRGPVLAATLNGEYGDKMSTALWRDFHLHTIVGHTVDGAPLVTADSEHLNARLTNTTVTSSAEVRQSTVGCTRTYTFDPAALRCAVQLTETHYNDLLNLWVKNPRRGHIAEAWEMIPFVPLQTRPAKSGKPEPTTLTLTAADGANLGPLTKTPTLCQTITLDRGGFGLRIALDQPRRVHRGDNHTLLIELTTVPTPASKLSLSYQLIPFTNP